MSSDPVHYKPDDSMKSPRFVGVRSFLKLPMVTDLEHVDVAVLGVPTDWAVGYRPGARFGPEGVRNASILLRTYNPALKVDIAENLSMVDYGDSPVWPGYHLETLEKIQKYLEPVYQADVVPLIIGGDHSLTMAELRAIHAVKGKVAVIHIDAHGDVLDDYYGGIKHFHGTVFRRAVEEGLVIPEKSVQAGMRGSIHPCDVGQAEELGFNVIPWDEMSEMTPQEFGERVRSIVGDTPVALSFDIDFIDPAFAPGTGTPEPGGPTTFEAYKYLRAIGGLNFCSMDLVEVAPNIDPTGVTAITAANTCFELLSLLALSKREGLLGKKTTLGEES
ncbi:agmatinase [Thalassomonas haliotis]|uniref:Agmatinase n=1 Tax=Thalassomonas haliotis TaxID=485448 RepID=A0ABY7VDT0_9GAMM|nr:agmatinase [Thalassomonas haliotis]WDE11822.1 agmatinase [Thalassomonas haliotis]